MVGGADRLRQSALDYANLRVQFGRNIASFQSMKHKQADMLVDVELAKSAAYVAAPAAAEDDAELPALASLAKACAAGSVYADGHTHDPDPWRHRLHLGQRHASLVQACEELRGVPRRSHVSSRADDAGMGGMTMVGARGGATHFCILPLPLREGGGR